MSLRYDYDAILAALEAFPGEFTERWRDVIELYWRREHSQCVTAIELGLTPGRVHQLVIEVRRRVALLGVVA